jgi:hypothetical protein
MECGEGGIRFVSWRHLDVGITKGRGFVGCGSVFFLVLFVYAMAKCLYDGSERNDKSVE